MTGGVLLPALMTLIAAVRLPLAGAEPVATVDRTDGSSVLAEFVAMSGGEVWIRRLTADRGTETIPVKEVKAIDFGDLPIELNAAGAILTDPDKPGDTSRLWWAADRGLFIILLRTCRFDTGTARPIAVLKMEKEAETRLAREDLAPERRRDLEIARVVLLFAKGQGEEARRLWLRLRDTYRDDPVWRQFAEELLIIRQEPGSRRLDGDVPLPPLGPRERPRSGERRDERRGPPNP